MPPRPTDIDPATAKRWLDAGEAELVDVREPDEHAREHIPGARLVPLSRFDPSAALPQRASRLVLHCKSGMRGADALSRIPPATEAYNLAGGIDAWKKAGLPTEVNRSAARISIMRQVQIVAGGSVLIGAALAWWVSPWFLIIPAFFGGGLLFSGLSGTCGMAAMLSLMPWNRASRGPS